MQVFLKILGVFQKTSGKNCEKLFKNLQIFGKVKSIEVHVKKMTHNYSMFTLKNEIGM